MQVTNIDKYLHTKNKFMVVNFTTNFKGRHGFIILAQSKKAHEV